MKLYHIDRTHRLSEGDVIKLFDDYKVTGPEGSKIRRYVRKLYPDGITEHGNRYLFDGKVGNWLLEAYLEAARLRSYPKAPSRFQSFFAVSADIIPQMRTRISANPSDPVFEVDSEHYDVYDMSLIDVLGDKDIGGFATLQYFADKYWAKERSMVPLLEYLVRPPVTIGPRI